MRRPLGLHLVVRWLCSYTKRYQGCDRYSLLYLWSAARGATEAGRRQRGSPLTALAPLGPVSCSLTNVDCHPLAIHWLSQLLEAARSVCADSFLILFRSVFRKRGGELLDHVSDHGNQSALFSFRADFTVAHVARPAWKCRNPFCVNHDDSSHRPPPGRIDTVPAQPVPCTMIVPPC